jgi:hypothetical protein
MAVERPPSATGFMFRIKMQHQSRDFAPVSTFRIRVEQTQIRDEVLLVVSGHDLLAKIGDPADRLTGPLMD